MVVVLVLLGVIFPSGCILASVLIGRHYLVRCREAARDADEYAEDAHSIAVDLRRQLDAAEQLDPDEDDQGEPDDPPTEVIPRVTPRTNAQRIRAAGAGSVGRHRLADPDRPSPRPRPRRPEDNA